MRVAITGATGLLGANLAAHCRAAGHNVVATHRATSRRDHLQDLGLEWVHAPLSDLAALTRAFDGADAVFHCAAQTSLLATPTPSLLQTNVQGTEHVLAAVRAAGAGRLVHTSSTVAIGVSDDGTPCTEASPWNLPDHGLADGYAVTKRRSEQAVLEACEQGLDAVVVNPGYLFGPRDARPSSGQMVLEVASGRALLASPGRNSFTSVADVARGMLAALDHGERGERYVLAGHNLTYLDMFGRIAAVVGRRAPLGTAPPFVGRMVGRWGDLRQRFSTREIPLTTQTVKWGYTPGFIASSARAEAQLGYRVSPIEDAIRDAWTWFRDQGLA